MKQMLKMSVPAYTTTASNDYMMFKLEMFKNNIVIPTSPIWHFKNIQWDNYTTGLLEVSNFKINPGIYTLESFKMELTLSMFTAEINQKN